MLWLHLLCSPGQTLAEKGERQPLGEQGLCPSAAQDVWFSGGPQGRPSPSPLAPPSASWSLEWRTHTIHASSSNSHTAPHVHKTLLEKWGQPGPRPSEVAEDLSRPWSDVAGGSLCPEPEADSRSQCRCPPSSCGPQWGPSAPPAWAWDAEPQAQCWESKLPGLEPRIHRPVTCDLLVVPQFPHL